MVTAALAVLPIPTEHIRLRVTPRVLLTELLRSGGNRPLTSKMPSTDHCFDNLAFSRLPIYFSNLNEEQCNLNRHTWYVNIAVKPGECNQIPCRVIRNSNPSKYCDRIISMTEILSAVPIANSYKGTVRTYSVAHR